MSERKRSRRGALTPEDRLLWKKIVDTIDPLPGRKPPPMPAEEAAAVPPPPAKAAKPPRAQPLSVPKPAKPRPPALAPLEPKLARTLKRGGAVDARLDLHGFRQDEAHARLIGFLQGQQARGARVVLVITGKGKRDDSADPFAERGVLRRLVPVWLAEPSLRHVVIGFSEASVAHGGAGALYVRLRRGA